jgi:hypothetical protein
MPPVSPSPLTVTEFANLLWEREPTELFLRPNLYCLLDGARDPAIYETLCRMEDRLLARSLYQGDSARRLATVAPYLVRIEPDLVLLKWLWEEGWGKAWGVYLWSGSTLDVLRDHFRRLVQVAPEDGESLFFRFYDPRVLRVFLPTCSYEQLRQVFGPVARFVTESEDAATALRFSFPLDGLKTRSLKLS